MYRIENQREIKIAGMCVKCMPTLGWTDFTFQNWIRPSHKSMNAKNFQSYTCFCCIVWCFSQCFCCAWFRNAQQIVTSMHYSIQYRAGAVRALLHHSLACVKICNRKVRCIYLRKKMETFESVQLTVEQWKWMRVEMKRNTNRGIKTQAQFQRYFFGTYIVHRNRFEIENFFSSLSMPHILCVKHML